MRSLVGVEGEDEEATAWSNTSWGSDKGERGAETEGSERAEVLPFQLSFYCPTMRESREFSRKKPPSSTHNHKTSLQLGLPLLSKRHLRSFLSLFGRSRGRSIPPAGPVLAHNILDDSKRTLARHRPDPARNSPCARSADVLPNSRKTYLWELTGVP